MTPAFIWGVGLRGSSLSVLSGGVLGSKIKFLVQGSHQATRIVDVSHVGVEGVDRHADLEPVVRVEEVLDHLLLPEGEVLEELLVGDLGFRIL